MAGLRPVAEIMTINFAFLALDAIINHAAKVHYMFNGQFKAPLVIRTTNDQRPDKWDYTELLDLATGAGEQA
jgi:pyruvate/2-oxoglutarate/acetoin dehydrogenase E1 component